MADHDGVIVNPSEPLPPSVDGAHPSDVVTINLDGDGPAPRVRRRVMPMVVATGAVLALIVGVGAYVIYRGFLAGGPRPEHATPGSVAAFVSVDLELSLNQRVTLAKLVGKIGDARPAGEDPAADDVLGSLLEELDLTGVDIKRDLTSWLGLRMALSMWFDDRSRVYALLTAASTDDAKAKEGLGRIKAGLRDTDLGFVVQNGQALVAIGEQDAQRAADAAAAEAATAPLESLASFQKTRSWLGDGQLVVAWMDIERYGRGLTGALAGQLGGGGEPPPGFAGPRRGTWAMGLKATDDGFEARYRSFDAGLTGGGVRDAVTRLSHLPADTEVGAVMGIPTGPLSTFSSPVSPYAMVVGVLMGGLLFEPSTPDLPVQPRELTPAEMKEVDKLLSKDPGKLTAAEKKRLEELIGFSPGEPSAPVDEVADPFESFAGAVMSVAITRLTGGATFQVIADTTSAEAAKNIGRQLTAGRERGPTVAVRDDIVTIASDGYVAGSGRLADRSRFQQVMAGAPAETDVAVYADLESALTAAQRQRMPVRAVGLVQGMDGGDQVGMLRILV